LKFWDTSAIVPLLVAEASTRRLQAIAARSPAMLVWWGSEVECVSAVARLERNGALEPQAVIVALKRLQQLSAGWHEIDPSDAVRETAARFLRVHPLRAADALQLAAAFLGSERRPASLEMVTLDDRLAAARKEGFPVIDLAPSVRLARMPATRKVYR
jgi:predicted nucleic acid-binding protein